MITEVYKGKIFTITQSTIIDEKGVSHLIEKCKRADVVSILGITDKKNLIFIQEFRSGAGRYTLWLPGGRVEPNETSLEAAAREFFEETGFRAEKLILFHEKSPSDSIDGNGFVYIATGISKQTAPKGDESGNIEVLEISLSDAKELAFTGVIKNEFFAFLILKLDYLLNKNEISLL